MLKLPGDEFVALELVHKPADAQVEPSGLSHFVIQSKTRTRRWRTCLHGESTRMSLDRRKARQTSGRHGSLTPMVTALSSSSGPTGILTA